MKNLNLLLLPGLLNDARLWRHQIDGLADIAYVTVAELTDADSMATLAANVLKQAPNERFALAGLSMGGYVALEVMRQAPERVMALALLDTTARPDTPQSTEARHKLMELAETKFTAVLDTLIPKQLHPQHLKDATMVETIKAMAKTVGKEAFFRQQRAIIGRIDSRPHLSKIKCPTLILCGREDAITPVEVHEEMKAAIPSSQFTIIEECGHLSALEQPKRVTETLRTWLRKVTSNQSVDRTK